MEYYIRISKNTRIPTIFFIVIALFFLWACNPGNQNKNILRINESEYFEARGFNVMVFSNRYNSNFDDSKMSGVEIIHHGVRTATNGDVRLSPTPAQWDPIPVIGERNVDRENQVIEVTLSYPNYNFNYRLRAQAIKTGIRLSVLLDEELPPELEGRAGFNLEFLPSAYFEKAYLMDSVSGLFPLYPGGPMEITSNGSVEPQAIARGMNLTLAPEDREKRITIESESGELMLFDGRNQAQNGWFVVRSLLPAGVSGEVIQWNLSASVIPGWIREPVIGHSQVGYHPGQKKVAVIELDRDDKPSTKAFLLEIAHDGNVTYNYTGKVESWGDYLRYKYYTFDFSEVKKEGLYCIEYNHRRTQPFRIAADVYENAWQPTLDVYFPVQMDHMFVNEAYRVWHGAAHLDDALQAPVNHTHFDLYAQGPETHTPFKPGEHIPGLNVGGWFDAGDFDIRTQSQYFTVLSLVQSWELFRPERDETTIDQKNRYVDIHHPDGKPDIVQQIEHGVLQLMAQYKATGHAINGIIVPDLSQYSHLGDAMTMTDNLIYNPALDSLESDGFYSGTFDDRWAFTNETTSLNYGSAAALAAASRVLKGYNDKLAGECLKTAVNVWDKEHSRDPLLFSHGNTTGGNPEYDEFNCAIELLLATGEQKFAAAIENKWDVIEKQFNRSASLAVRAMPYLDRTYREKIRKLTRNYRDTIDKQTSENPYGVPVSRGGWAGNGWVMFYAATNYWLHTAFPDIIDREYVLRGLNYIYGCHPGSDISFVSAVGTHSKKVAYGNNRADFSFIAGGIVPGMLILPPDFPENKEDWPFLWGENEYVIPMGAMYLFMVHAAMEVLEE